MRVFTYVIVHDSGAAPQHAAPMTLAICKPKIRRSARPGDLVLAFTGADLGPEPHSVRWAGIVGEKLTFAEYWCDPRFAHKKPAASTAPDNIYRPVNGGYLRVPNPIHDESNVSTDLGGEYVLVFERAWYFGAAAPLLPDEFGLRIAGNRRGHRVATIDARSAARLTAWLDAHRMDARPGSLTGGRCPPAKPAAVPVRTSTRRSCQ